MNDATTFSGFPEKALPFLKALGFHQSREWFLENKKIYESCVKIPLGDLVEAISYGCEAEKIPLRGARKTSLYRVNRDVRFSKNKDPYNTHMSAMLTRNGTKKEQGFVYMHFSNERSFIASGFYGLTGDELRAMRELIVREPDVMTKECVRMEAAGYTLDLSESLKRQPRGFDTGNAKIDAWLRLKHFTFIEEIDNDIIVTPEIQDRLVRLAKQSLAFLNFGWRAVDSVREDASK